MLTDLWSPARRSPGGACSLLEHHLHSAPSPSWSILPVPPAEKSSLALWLPAGFGANRLPFGAPPDGPSRVMDGRGVTPAACCICLRCAFAEGTDRSAAGRLGDLAMRLAVSDYMDIATQDRRMRIAIVAELPRPKRPSPEWEVRHGSRFDAAPQREYGRIPPDFLFASLDYPRPVAGFPLPAAQSRQHRFSPQPAHGGTRLGAVSLIGSAMNFGADRPTLAGIDHGCFFPIAYFHRGEDIQSSCNRV